MQARYMWQGGPLRQWAPKQPKGKSWVKLAGDGFAGSYVCERCQRPVDGVYRVLEPQKWVCGPCKDALKSEASKSIWRVA